MRAAIVSVSYFIPQTVFVSAHMPATGRAVTAFALFTEGVQCIRIEVRKSEEMNVSEQSQMNEVG